VCPAMSPNQADMRQLDWEHHSFWLMHIRVPPPHCQVQTTAQQPTAVSYLSGVPHTATFLAAPPGDMLGTLCSTLVRLPTMNARR
jgi:hypothetical protein